MRVHRKCVCSMWDGAPPYYEHMLTTVKPMIQQKIDRIGVIEPGSRRQKPPAIELLLRLRCANPPTMPTVSMAELRDQLREAGLRATGARIAVLRVLRSALSPLSHNDVAEQLVGEPWDRATLYRNLLDIVRSGLARRTDLGDHVWRFELAQSEHDRSEHPHFVCTDCGVVECLPSSAVTMRTVQSAPASFRERKVEVQVRGRCDRCHPRGRKSK
jgi:Fur family transcriptional regulator, ferric uptake regulator